MSKDENSEKYRKAIREKLGLEPKEEKPKGKSPTNNKPPNNKKNGKEKLVSVEIQKEFDVLDQAWENKVFVKLFVAARTSGLLKKISDREFKTLIALALYMDEDGNCYPSQHQIAKDLGCSRETVNRRIQSLLKFRFNGKPIVKSVKIRNKEGRWENTRYTILPVSQLKIFEKPSKKEVEVKESTHVTKSSHGPCDDVATWQNRHTNKNHTLNKNQYINNVKRNATPNNRKKKKRSPEKEAFAKELAEQLEDDHSLGFYRLIVDKVSDNLIFQTLSEVKDKYLTNKIKKSKAALFNSIIQAKAKENNIELNLKESKD